VTVAAASYYFVGVLTFVLGWIAGELMARAAAPPPAEWPGAPYDWAEEGTLP
jgi:hypothetical protein